MRSQVALGDDHVPRLLAEYGLGVTARLSDAPVGEGRVGSIWRLDTDLGPWVVKPVVDDDTDADLAEVADGAAFQEAAARSGVPTPAVRRTLTGDVLGDLGDVRVLVQSWVDLRDPDLGLDPPAVGRLLAGLHRVDFAGVTGQHPWYSEPVGARTWRKLVADLRRRRAPFADEVDALLPELHAVEALLGEPPRSLRTCHRDLWADNLRATGDGGLCVIDFDNAGLTDPSQELAMVLVEFAAGDAARARLLLEAYAEAGGPGRVLGPGDFSMPIAQLGHILETGCRRWLAAGTDADRRDNEGWVREYLERPLTLAVIEALLEA